MDMHWVAAMVGLTGANWAVCSADMMAVCWAVLRVVLLAAWKEKLKVDSKVAC